MGEPETQAAHTMKEGGKGLPGCFAIAMGVIALLFVALSVLGWMHLWRTYAAYAGYAETTCVLLSSGIVKGGKLGGTYYPQVEFEYSVGGARYTSRDFDGRHTHSMFKSRIETALLAEGRERACWYDPGDPAKSVLVRPFPWLYAESYVMALVLPLFALVSAVVCGFEIREWRAQRRK